VPSLHQVRVAWTGLKGLPGVSTHYFSGLFPELDLQTVGNAYEALATALPAGLTITVPDSGMIIDEATGQATGTWSIPEAGTTVTGSVGTGYAAPCGAVVNWTTGIFLAGRQVRGKTFLVPLPREAYQADGTLVDTYRGVITNYAEAMVSISSFVIYTPSNNGSASVDGFTVPDMVAVLRSRRD
jgi:hypothetical protein